MKITWIGHSCFKVEENGFAVVLDPFKDGSVPGIGNVREEAQLVLCSHEHGDHNARECVRIVEGPANPFMITEIDTWHDEVQGAKRGKNKITLLEANGVRVAHLGDLGCELTAAQAELLGGLDLLLIPVGGFFTIDAKEASALVAQLAPKHVIPMHYKTADFGFDVIGSIDLFISQTANALEVKTSSVEVSELPKEQVLVLTPALLNK